jgi:signal transduction histidine kinase
MGLARLARVADVVVVVLLALSAQAQIWAGDPSAWPSGRGVNAVLAALVTVPLLVRRRHPLPVLCVVVIAARLQFERDAGLGQGWFALVLALYSVCVYGSRREALLGAAVGAASLLAADVAKLREGQPWDDVVPAWFFLGALYGFARWMSSRRLEMAQLQEQTTRLERDREAMTQAAVATERARIARELHDLVAHSMGVIVIQSQAAQRLLPSDPATAQRAMVSIEVTGRQGLAEMRRLLDVLIGSDEQAPLAPQPGMRQLDALLDQVRMAGLSVDLQVEGDPRTLPPGVDLSAYRIVQEALTNTLRHAGPAQARVSLRFRPDGVDVEVADDGKATASAPGRVDGHGLIGMRERVTLYGGSLSTGCRREGGYVVRAHLPTDSPHSTVA